MNNVHELLGLEFDEYLHSHDNLVDNDLRAATATESTPVHKLADSHVPDILVAVQYAFAAGRRAIDREALASAKTEAAMLAATQGVTAEVDKALRRVLYGTLMRAVVAGGGLALQDVQRSAAARSLGGPGSGNPGHSGGAGGGDHEYRTARPKAKSVTVKFGINNTRAAHWAKTHAAELVKGITKTTRNNIRQAVTRLFTDEDVTHRDLYTEVLDAVGDEVRARLIARNESMMAVSEGQREGWMQAIEEGLLPPNTRRTWIITPIDPCPICLELDGAVTGINGQYPAPGGDGPPQHVNCRCTEGVI